MLQLRSALRPSVSEKQPASIQEETDLQAGGWHREWGSELLEAGEPQWPSDIGPLPPRLVEDDLLEAAMTFPTGTGLV